MQMLRLRSGLRIWWISAERERGFVTRFLERAIEDLDVDRPCLPGMVGEAG